MPKHRPPLDPDSGQPVTQSIISDHLVVIFTVARAGARGGSGEGRSGRLVSRLRLECSASSPPTAQAAMVRFEDSMQGVGPSSDARGEGKVSASRGKRWIMTYLCCTTLHPHVAEVEPQPPLLAAALLYRCRWAVRMVDKYTPRFHDLLAPLARTTGERFMLLAGIITTGSGAWVAPR